MKKKLPFLKEQLTENWLYKLVAFIVALAIWSTTIMGRKDTMLLRSMDLEFVLRPQYAITNMIEKNVQVKVSGPRSILKRFSQSNGAVTINLTQEEPGVKKITIRQSDLNLPTGIKLVSIEPDTFELTIKEVKKP